MNFYLWNMFANLKNGQILKKSCILQRKTSICSNVLKLLWDEGFILGYKTYLQNPDYLIIFLKYDKNIPAIKKITGISKPGKRIYLSVKDIWKTESSSGLFIITTNKGIFSLNMCRQLNIGGEPLFYIQ